MVTLSCPVPDELAGSWRRAPRSFNHLSSSLLDGQLRFMPPTGTLEKWEGVRVALRHRPVCPQPAAPSADKLRGDGVPLGHGIPLGHGVPLGRGVPLARAGFHWDMEFHWDTGFHWDMGFHWVGSSTCDDWLRMSADRPRNASASTSTCPSLVG